MHAFLDQFGINLASFGSGTLTPPQRESLAKEAAAFASGDHDCGTPEVSR